MAVCSSFTAARITEKEMDLILKSGRGTVVSSCCGRSMDMSINRRHRKRTQDMITQVSLMVSFCFIMFLVSCAEAFSYSRMNSCKNTIQSRAGLPSDLCNCNTAAVQSSSSRVGYGTTKLYNLFPKDEFDKDPFLDDEDDDDEYNKYEPAIAAQLRKAKKLLKDAKAKQKEAEDSFLDTPIDNKEDDNKKSKAALPFFASNDAEKIKSKTDSGEIIADGNAMSEIAAKEAWERRSLTQMFDKEARKDWDGNDVLNEIDGSVLADRDVARSIYNLRKSMQNDDFKKVFDPRNRFIGEVE